LDLPAVAFRRVVVGVRLVRAATRLVTLVERPEARPSARAAGFFAAVFLVFFAADRRPFEVDRTDELFGDRRAAPGAVRDFATFFPAGLAFPVASLPTLEVRLAFFDVGVDLDFARDLGEIFRLAPR